MIFGPDKITNLCTDTTANLERVPGSFNTPAELSLVILKK